MHQLTGFAFSVFFWIEVLQDIFADEVSGVDCVLQTKDSRGREEWHTYLIENGEAFYKATGDVHDSDYDKFQETIVLSGESLFNKDSPVYTLAMYPSDHFFESYSTPNPRRASIGAVCIIFFVSVLFFLYDYFVRRDIHKRQSVLEAKRTFMRFVSHEVRTPLVSHYAVCPFLFHSNLMQYHTFVFTEYTLHGTSLDQGGGRRGIRPHNFRVHQQQ